MIGSYKKKSLRLIFALFSLFISTAAAVSAQSTAPKPFFQPINVQPSPTPVPLIKKTASSSPIGATAAAADIVNPADITIPGYSGVLVETLEGKVVRESSSNYAFNPASNVKIATAYAVIKTFGPDYRFPTNVFTDGEIDPATGTLNGNLYVSGRDPVFNLEHGVAIADALNKSGIRAVNGDLIVTGGFIMAMNGSSQASANTLFTNLNSVRRSAAATRAWQTFLNSGVSPKNAQQFPGVVFSGKVYVDIIPSNARLLFTHESAPLKEIVKVTLCYSNNFLAERLGDMLGGPYAVARTVQLNAGIPAEQFILQTSSGLGINRVTPQAMMKLLRAFRGELTKAKLTFADVMPIAGVDPGTLQRRLNTQPTLGSVVAKTGTLGNTDGGASSLAGEMQTRKGKILFVIFNQRGSNARFRSFQDNFLMTIQAQFGGAAPLGYPSPALSLRMSNTRITYPDTRARRVG